MKSLPRELIAIGRIVKPFGIRGDLIVKPMSGDPGRFSRLRRVFVGSEKDGGRDGARAVFERVSIDSRGVRVKLSGVDDRTAAERFVGSFLFVEEDDRIPLPEGTFFVHDVIGLAVINQEGATIGTVTDVMRLPGNDVYVIDAGGREVLIPAVRAFVKQVDLATRSMRVSLIEGLVEE